MIKTFTLSTFAVFLSLLVGAQSFVYTGPGPQKILLEEFSGVNCPNCPDGHAVIESLLTTYPNDELYVVGYNPSNSNFTSPVNGATDFRRTFLDAFYNGSYVSPSSGSRFMPSAIINRRIWNDGNRLQSRGQWPTYVDQIVNEGNDGKMNIAVRSTHNSVSNELTIDIEIFYLEDVTDDHSILVYINENGLTSNYQSGSNASPSDPYEYAHLFRENVSTGQWGDAITDPTTSGSTVTLQYTFDLDNAIDPINVANADVMAFLVDDNTTEVLNVVEAEADGGEASTGTFDNTSVNELINSEPQFELYPNPADDIVNIRFEETVDNTATISIYNIYGQLVQVESVASGSQIQEINTASLAAGFYNVILENGTITSTKKLSIR